jgi:hypothetical protein
VKSLTRDMPTRSCSTDLYRLLRGTTACCRRIHWKSLWDMMKHESLCDRTVFNLRCMIQHGRQYKLILFDPAAKNNVRALTDHRCKEQWVNPQNSKRHLISINRSSEFEPHVFFFWGKPHVFMQATVYIGIGI